MLKEAFIINKNNKTNLNSTYHLEECAEFPNPVIDMDILYTPKEHVIGNVGTKIELCVSEYFFDKFNKNKISDIYYSYIKKKIAKK